MSRIFWDTNLFVYLLEGAGKSFDDTQRVAMRMAERKDTLLTSALTLGELLVKPLQAGRADLADRYEQLLSTRGIQVIDFDRVAARMYAVLRQDRSIKPPDAIQLACAAAAGTNLFITNDARLSKKSVPGIDFIVGLPQAYL